MARVERLRDLWPAEIVNYRTMDTTPVYLASGLAVGAVAPPGSLWWRRYGGAGERWPS
jgi:hypothetical protein